MSDEALTDDQLAAAIEHLLIVGPDALLPDDVADRLTEAQGDRYAAAVDRALAVTSRLWFRAAVRLHSAWWAGPAGRPLPPLGAWRWEPSAPNDPSGPDA